MEDTKDVLHRIRVNPYESLLTENPNTLPIYELIRRPYTSIYATRIRVYTPPIYEYIRLPYTGIYSTHIRAYTLSIYGAMD